MAAVDVVQVTESMHEGAFVHVHCQIHTLMNLRKPISLSVDALFAACTIAGPIDKPNLGSAECSGVCSLPCLCSLCHLLLWQCEFGDSYIFIRHHS